MFFYRGWHTITENIRCVQWVAQHGQIRGHPVSHDLGWLDAFHAAARAYTVFLFYLPTVLALQAEEGVLESIIVPRYS